MKYVIKISCVAATFILASCGSFDGVGGGAKPVSVSTQSPASANSDIPVRLGSPFKVGTTNYTPEDVANYDAVGYASYYGKDFAGKNTANGEVFVPSAIGAAHKTLPMPTYVEVTALDTGRTILVRINDRGPFDNDRLIDLSEGAARQLGILEQGVAGVRVRKVNPPEQERSVLRAGLPAAERIATPESLLRVLRNNLAQLPKPKESTGDNKIMLPTTASTQDVGVSKQNAVTSTTDGRFIRENKIKASTVTSTSVTAKPEIIASGYVVQVAAFSSKARADTLAKKMGAHVVTSNDGKIYRVQLGPYASAAEGQAGLETARKHGFPKANLFQK